jgi:hypothetical protein
VVIKIKVESMGSLPPALISPLGVKTLNLQIQSHLSPFEAAKSESLTKFAPELTIDPFEQGSTSDPLAVEPFKLKVCNGRIKIPFKGSHRLRGFFTPSRGPSRELLSGLLSTLSFIDSAGLLHQLLSFLFMLISFEFGSALVPHVLELMENAPLINHGRTIDQTKSLKEAPTSITSLPDTF